MAIETSAVPPIVVDSASKTFRVPEETSHTLKERALHPMRRTRHHSFKAFDDISFEVSKGEFFGIAGRNGSGKSTLLKCLAGIYGLDTGRIWMNGRLSTFIELGVGFNADLAARDNVVLNGIMMGLSPREARSRYDAVIDFAELREFEELKLKNYSSGMHVRLAFAVAIQVDADILLVDEILAVGDAAFQQKCFDVFNEMRDKGRTIVFVTHDMGALNRFCHRALLLERGVAVHLGDPQEVADRYLEINFNRDPGDAGGVKAVRGGDGHARIVEAWAEDEQGNRQTMFPQGRRVTFKARVLFSVDVEHPAASLTVLNDQHTPMVVANSARDDDLSGLFAAGEEATFEFSLENVFAPGRYFPLFMLAHRGSGLDLIDRLDGAFSFMSTASLPLGGLVELPVHTQVTRDAETAAPLSR
jgi:ABC-type polysaccharide/polyol phosphate transport system ATPase subunit